ncbi:glycine dehydrogenase [Ceraceosorus bombacis]|uniref:Glycine dehydrogenase n=1 Tax=Ceraceosorus bombacis TaxID=401625 RepID=A0A0P1BMZ2_9BASI|nr:glycine dehydrogenase [Ceraceosorus bombacis]
MSLRQSFVAAVSLRTTAPAQRAFIRTASALPAASPSATPSSTSQAPSSRALASQAQPLPLGSVSESVFAPLDDFSPRHIGPRDEDIQKMLAELDYKSLDDFIADAVPKEIRLDADGSKTTESSSSASATPIVALSESELARRGLEIAEKNANFKSLIGLGYHNTNVPPVILRNVLENPAWYTSYTPYQPEIAQGRLESLLNYQTMVKSLTGLDISNASLLDEGTAAAEAMTLSYGHGKSKRKTFLVDARVLPQTISVLRQRARGFEINVEVVNLSQGLPEVHKASKDVMGVLVQYPDIDGRLKDWSSLAEETHKAGGLVVCAADLLALTMVKPPGEWGADIAVGSSARFGVPPGFGGPHAAFFAVRDKLTRKMPGRLIGTGGSAALSRSFGTSSAFGRHAPC